MLIRINAQFATASDTFVTAGNDYFSYKIVTGAARKLGIFIENIESVQVVKGGELREVTMLVADWFKTFEESEEWVDQGRPALFEDDEEFAEWLEWKAEDEAEMAECAYYDAGDYEHDLRGDR